MRGIIMKKLALLLSLCVLGISGFACAMEYPGDKGSGKRLLELASGPLEQKKAKSGQQKELLPIEITPTLHGNFTAEIKVDGRPIANIDYGPDTDDEEEGKIKLLRVNKKERGKGYGERLMRSALDHLKQKGFSTVYLSVRKDKKPARKLYEKLGFVEDKDEEHETLSFYSKDLTKEE